MSMEAYKNIYLILHLPLEEFMTNQI